MPMKPCCTVFERIEKKYGLTPIQYQFLQEALAPYMKPDEYGESTVCSVYFDTEQYDLIRRSIEKPSYKEKFRVRSYGVPSENSPVFLEIKKKYKKIVYKRREVLPLLDARRYLEQGIYPQKDSQILREIDYFLQLYHPVPKVYLAYDRVALCGSTPESEGLRITFDTNIRSRTDHLCLSWGDKAEPLFSEPFYLMEVKCAAVFPLWLTHLLSQAEVFPTSFSKYGNVYRSRILPSLVTV